MTSETPNVPNVLLYCLGGAAAPADLAPSLNACADLDEEATAKLPQVVAACLEALPEDQLKNRVDRHCRQLQLDAGKVMQTVLGARFMLHAGAETNTTPEDLGKDLNAVGAASATAWLVPLYREVVGALRTDIARSAITSHGRVLTGVEWRVDTVGASNRGRDLNLPVALVTMHYVDGTQEGRITLQMLPDMVNELRAVCEQLLT